ncbi:NB-ARC domain-containing protein [Micromonospora rhizosphaerae]|uniref:NB-ARC domain-containing protein n=1 Tax=Micromonospora rhizosphaerae TaxID=568872 RepID=A0A1C6SRD3_9ACTN|nr:BTAD domain-containing putative transcriptional regulator [Micromonospora rhizosphaerae]SCL31869.1 NB-ARC domain-containing protein [Micromonospora rhizosphaerae]
MRHTLYVYIARLRGLIAAAAAADGTVAAVVRRSRGYVLDVDPDRVDVHRFRRLVEQARDPHCPDTKRVALLRQALALWRGTPLADLPGDWAARVREGLQQQRLDAVVCWAEAELRRGNAGDLVGPLTDLIAEHPLVEPLAALLMRALHSTGRTATALDCYVAMRRRLVDQVGMEPGAELQQLHRAILRGDLDQASGWGRERSGHAVPAQLPLDVHGFAGRDTELCQLDAILTAAGEEPTTVAILALTGTAGVGKTALAMHWAHRVANRFPDGQLYVNLRGFDANSPATRPDEALRALLDALQVPPQRVPASLAAQVGLYRSLLADRRVLVVLDNASDADQVRPLLPGSPGCLVVVTSRNQLPGLVAAEGAHPLTLGLLSTDDARQMLARRLGPERVAAEPRSVDDIIARCAQLPLALAIVAARAATHPEFPLGMLVADLGDSSGGLEPFSGGDPSTDVRAVFSWSYRTLSPSAARLFRLLAVHPGPDIATTAAASLIGAPPGQVRPLLAELARAHLVTEHPAGRFAFHDLLRAYATELVEAVDADTDRSAGACPRP